jgi:hypothetical protein
MVIAVTVCASCWLIDLPWRHHGEFIAELQCGMTAAEIGQLAERYNAEGYGIPLARLDPRVSDELKASLPDFFVSSGSTHITIWFVDGGLDTVKDGHTDNNGYTVVDREIDVCGVNS